MTVTWGNGSPESYSNEAVWLGVCFLPEVVVLVT